MGLSWVGEEGLGDGMCFALSGVRKGLILVVALFEFGLVPFTGEKGFFVFRLEEDAVGRVLGSITAGEASDHICLDLPGGDGVRNAAGTCVWGSTVFSFF